MKSLSTSKQTMALYSRYTLRYKAEFLVGAIGAIFANVAQTIIAPFVIARTFAKLQTAYADHQRLVLHEFRPYIVTYAAAMLVGAVFWRLQSYFVWQYEFKVKRDIANDVYNHLQAQSQRFHADHFAGALVSQTNKFISSYERLMDDLIWNIIPGISTLVFGIGVLLFVSPYYALVLLLVAVLYFFVMSKRVVRQLPYNVDEAAKESQQTAALADAVANLTTVRAFAQEEHESALFAAKVNAVYQSGSKLSVEVLKTEAISQVQTNGFQIIAFLGGLVAVTSFGANVSVLYLVLSYTQNIVNQLWQFSRIIRNVNRSFGDATEMTDILGLQPEIQDTKQKRQLESNTGSVSFNSVTFYYPENREHPLFQNLSFSVKPGEKIGLVGPSGGGKTTITKLLLRFMDIQSGTIKIDHENIAKLPQSVVRSHIAYVAQEPILFHRSIADNIRYGNLEATDQAVIEAAKKANAHQFIAQLPDGYGTFVGERGVKLSGGQRQRVAIARAMLKNAPILVLDEATSALDSESEVLIQAALWKLMEGRTALVIAHRLSTIQHMDRIIVLKEGAVTEEGSHIELLRNKHGTYAKLWAHQSGGFMEE
jgi:ATP-binding cassette subfamily B protein